MRETALCVFSKLLKTHFRFLFLLGSSFFILRLYRKYKREQITRKILEYEAEMERDGADEDNRASRRYQASSTSSSSSEESYRHHKRGRRSARKSGKKVRARSRPPVDRQKSTEKSPESSPVAEKPPALPPKESKKTKQVAKKQEDEEKQGSYHHFRHGNGKARFELIRDSGYQIASGDFLTIGVLPCFHGLKIFQEFLCGTTRPKKVQRIRCHLPGRHMIEFLVLRFLVLHKRR